LRPSTPSALSKVLTLLKLQVSKEELDVLLAAEKEATSDGTTTKATNGV
jgi:hypothetical protein